MFNPKYRILITSKCFPRDKVVCLGSQLIYIINSVKEFLPQHLWYGADIEVVGKGASKYNFNNIQLNLIGDDLQIVECCYEVEQFIWGVFLCIDNNFSSQNIHEIELETEDESFRAIKCNGVLMEIRAFDTTYFGVYSENEDLIKKMSKIYGVEIDIN